uniref:5'-3' DNA helicase ZGRF1-like N-terminal domain-containing protein n=1 Tax=Fusarium oxysporum (strain Fo5176) TaxID=660025 RepID=A0A0D2XID5_FUSOF
MTSGSIPTTALVVDFICLFTHDLKRKQKRWQDGVLKYHTFNKRVMVYDDRNHFIGDAHRQEGGDLEPGDEFELDRGAAIVQVSDCTGQREQDLTELLDKRAKEVEKRRTNAGTTRTPGSTAAVTQTPRSDQNAPHFQLRHRPLNDLVGGASRIGRAVISPHSPFEQRRMAESPGQQQDSPSEDARPSKRRRREESPPRKMGHARALFGTTLTLTPFSSSISSARSQPLHDRAAARPKVAPPGSRDGTSRRADRSSKSPPPSSNPEDTETSAPRQAAPRRVLTQRASLKELLAGNEHNRTSELPRTREPLPKNRTKASKPVKPRQPPPKDEVVSLLTQEPVSPKHPVDQAPVPPADNRPPRPKKTKGDPVPAIQRPAKESTRKVAQEPIVVDEDEDEDVEALPHPKTSRIRPESAVSKTTKRKETSTAEPHGTKRTLSTDRASATETATDKPPPAKEPRTELRIRSRQRRGLLMMAQRKEGGRPGSAGRPVPPSSGAGSDTQKTSHTIARAASISEEPQATERITTKTTASKKRQDSAKPSELHHSVEEPDDQSIAIHNPNTEEVAREKDTDNESEALKEPEVELVPSDDAISVSELSEDRRSPTPRRRTNPSRRTRNRAAPVVFSDNEGETSAFDSPARSDDEEEGLSLASKAGRKPEPKPSSGPRITKMSRKSVKSREIIGFVMPDEDFSMDGFNVGHAELVEVKKPSNDLKVAEKPPGKARDTLEAPANHKSVSDGLEAEQLRTNKKEPEKEQPPTKEKIPEPTWSSANTKEPDTVPRSTNSRAHEAAEPVLQEKEREIEIVRPPTNAKQPEIGQPATRMQEQEASASETGSRGPKVQESSAKEKESKEVQPAISEKELETVQPLTKEKNTEAEAPSTSGKRLEAAQPPAHGKEQQEKQRPRIVNPATRGRKAARKQDAAGLPPQTLVQFEPATSSRIAPAQPPKKIAPLNNVPQSELPVFCRANGGAWSRHAEDLLGMTRPTRRMPRR